MTEITVVRNDKYFPLYLTILDAENTPLDLTDADTIALHFLNYDGGQVFTIIGEILNATAGEVKLNVSEEFVGIAPGKYKAEVEVTFKEDAQHHRKVITAPNLLVSILEDIPVSG